MKKILVVSLFAILFIFNISFAKEDMQIELTLNEETIELNETVQLAITIKQASTENININNINIPGIENFNKTGSSQSTQVKIVNGATSAVTEQVYSLSSKKEGVFSLGPIVVKSNGKIIAESNVVNIEVIKSNRKSFFSDDNNDTESLKNKSSKNNWGKIFLNIGAFFLLLFMVKYLQKKKKDEQEYTEKKIEINESHSAEALRDEKEVRSKSLQIPNIADENFYKNCKENLLKYLEIKYDLELETQTTREIIEKLKENKVINIEEVIEVINICDNVRFMAISEDKGEIIEKLKNIR